MILNIKELTSALAKISAFASLEKAVPGVLLDVQENHVNVCYTDGRKTLIEKIGVTLGENEQPGKMIVDYKRLSDIIAVCQPSGIVYTDDVEFIVDGNIIKVKVEKKILQHESEEDEGEYKTFSIYEQSISWVPENANIKVALLTRVDYGKIFAAEEEDQWGVYELKSILSKTTAERTKVTYMSPKKECAFVANLASLSCHPIGDTHSIPVVLNNTVAKALGDVLSKINEDNVYVSVVDKKFCNIRTEDNTLGLSVEMVEPSAIHLNTLANYQAKEYKNYHLTFVKEILKDVVNSAQAVDKADKTVLKFTLEDEVAYLKIQSNNSGASIKNDYSVKCVDYKDRDSNLDKIELPISLKVLSELIAKCDTPYIGIDVDVDTNGMKCIRIAEIDLEEKSNTEEEIMIRLGIEDKNLIPMNEQLDSRERTLVAKHYTLSAK